MRNFRLALRNVAGRQRGQLGKIIFLGAGLAAGLVLLTKVWYENSYEDFYPDVSRIYQLKERIERNDEEPMNWEGTSGGYAPFLKERLPQIEEATRYTGIAQSVFFVGEEKHRFEGRFIVADDDFYEVLPRPMVLGNAKEALAKPMTVLVSESVAARLKGDPIGQSMTLELYPGRELFIGGVYEDLPKNTIHPYDVVIPMVSIGNFTGDGSTLLMGNDRYRSFLKVRKGTDIEELQAAIDQLVSELDVVKEANQQANMNFGIYMVPMQDVYKDNPDTRRTALVLLILSVAILFATVFNYLLVVLSDTMARGKSIAVMKSYGAGFREIAGIVLVETLLQLAVLLVIAGLLVLIFRNGAEQLLGNPVSDLLTWKSILMMLGVVFVILFISTYVQARVYNNIPVSTVFRNYRGTGRKVKLGLLFVQVAAAAFLAVLLVTVIRQYNAMINDDPGYDYENLLTARIWGVDQQRKNAIVWELESLDVVDQVSLATSLPLDRPSGNNIGDIETGKEFFNIADLESADHNYLKVLGVNIIDGRDFDRENSAPGDMMVSRSFVEKINNFVDWPDGPVGKDVHVSYWGEKTITGVYEDIKIGTIGAEDTRPSIIIYSENGGSHVLVKMKVMGTEAIERVNEVFKKVVPERDIAVSVYAHSLAEKYQDHLKFRKSITVASIIVMIIVFVGLIGYVKDETVRRQKEIAVRKINGATVSDILTLLGVDIMKMMAPAMVIGIIVSYFVANRWMQEFSVKVPFNIPLALLCAVVLAAVAVAAVSLSALKVARKNPAETIKSE